ncbi:TRAP transporter small permease [Gammaproteobacteria bacterium]|nr:TRAP transporter small permease [Gammaproteobacteria bacterium]
MPSVSKRRTNRAHPLRRALDSLYQWGAWLAAGFLLLILVTIVAQMVARWSGLVLPGSTRYAGYFMAASSFLALAWALNQGSHIRVSLLLGRLGRYRIHGERWCLALSALIAIYFARFAIKATWWSWFLKDVSQGQDATPLWIPQLSMAIGSSLLAIALVDNFVRSIIDGKSPIPSTSTGD